MCTKYFAKGELLKDVDDDLETSCQNCDARICIDPTAEDIFPYIHYECNLWNCESTDLNYYGQEFRCIIDSSGEVRAMKL